MLTSDEITRSLTGAWLLFRGRSDGLLSLDRSVAGFWRSFTVILLVIPLNALTLFAISRVEGSDASMNALFFGSLPLLVLNWIAFPAALALAAGPLGIRRTYASYIVARNWAAPLEAVIFTIPFILQGAGWIATAPAVLLSLVSIAVVMRFEYLIARIALKTTPAVSVGLVVADFILTLFLVALFG
jgi:hypothetical protein